MVSHDEEESPQIVFEISCCMEEVLIQMYDLQKIRIENKSGICINKLLLTVDNQGHPSAV